MDNPRISVGGMSFPVPRVSLQPLGLDLLGRAGRRTYSQIVGWGSYAPSRVLTNFELARTLDTDDDWIRSRTGIGERRIAGPKESTAVMAVRAARAALRAADVSPRKVDLVVLATTTPDHPIPASAPMVQDALGAANAAAFDVNAGCSGFMYGLALANGLIAVGSHRNALVIGAETLSRIVDWTDRGTCVLFADGAGAVLLQATDQPTGLLSYNLGSDGFGRDLLKVPAGGSRRPASHETVEHGEHFVRMKGHELFRSAVDKMAKAAQLALAEAGLQPGQVALVIPHQANLRIIHAVAHHLRMPEDKFFVNIDRYGNTSSASIPIALAEAIEAGRVKQGDYLLLVAFGAGLTWGAAVVQWGVPAVVPAVPVWKVLLDSLNVRQRQLQALSRRARGKLDLTRWLDGL